MEIVWICRHFTDLPKDPSHQTLPKLFWSVDVTMAWMSLWLFRAQWNPKTAPAFSKPSHPRQRGLVLTHDSYDAIYGSSVDSKKFLDAIGLSDCSSQLLRSWRSNVMCGIYITSWCRSPHKMLAEVIGKDPKNQPSHFGFEDRAM